MIQTCLFFTKFSSKLMYTNGSEIVVKLTCLWICNPGLPLQILPLEQVLVLEASVYPVNKISKYMYYLQLQYLVKFIGSTVLISFMNNLHKIWCTQVIKLYLCIIIKCGIAGCFSVCESCTILWSRIMCPGSMAGGCGQHCKEWLYIVLNLKKFYCSLPLKKEKGWLTR